MLERDALVRKHLPLVKAIASSTTARLPASITWDEVYSSGTVGLLNAIDCYNETRCDNFATYARIRIRGAILDELRCRDWVPRSVRDEQRRLNTAHHNLEQALGCLPKAEQLAAALNISVEQYHTLRERTSNPGMMLYDDFKTECDADFLDTIAAPVELEPEEIALQREQRAQLEDAMAHALTQRERLILMLHTKQEHEMKAIGARLGVSESRISQLRTRAVNKLRAYITKQEKQHARRAA